MPVGKQRIEKERKRREKEHKKKQIDDIGWKVPRDFILRTDIKESVYCSVYDYRRPIQVEEILTTSYTPGAVDEYKGWEIAYEDALYEALSEASLSYEVGEPDPSEVFDFWSQEEHDLRRWYVGQRRWWRREKKRVEWLNSGVTDPGRPAQSSKKRSTRKRSFKNRDLHRLDRVEGLDKFE